MRRLLAAVALVVTTCAAPKPRGPVPIDLAGRREQHPLSPEDSLRAFRVQPGFRVELVAAEPHVASPVGMTFDEDGRIYIAEMLDYPLVRTPGMFGPFPEGQIRRLELDDDGRVKKSTVFAHSISLPSSVLPWNGGILVTAAPDILFFKDTDGDGYADERKTILTGFDAGHDLSRINSLNWGIDGWIYARGVGNTPVRWGDDPRGPTLSTDKMDIRFQPRERRFEAVTGMSSSHGLALDDFGRRFFSDSSHHIHQNVLPASALRRNPYLAGPTPYLDISDHESAAKIFRISEPQQWRAERSQMWKQAGWATKSAFWRTEARHDYMTAVTGPEVYRESLFPLEYRGSYFVAEASANLVHRDVLAGDGPALRASRAHADSEFLASADPWMSPTCVESGPDGALYICDMYRRIIEEPADLQQEILQKYGMRGGSTMGRIWRVTTEAGRFVRPALGRATPRELAATLDHPSAWWRTTAQRLILEHPETADVNGIEAASRSRKPAARVQALWTLEALGKLASASIRVALADGDPGVRENALQMAEPRLVREPALAEAALKMTGDASGRVRFQLAVTLAELEPARRLPALAVIAQQGVKDRFTRAAVLAAVGDAAAPFCRAAVVDPRLAGIIADCAGVVGARLDEREVVELLAAVVAAPSARQSVLQGLTRGIKRRGRKDIVIAGARAPLATLADDPAPAVRAAAAELADLLHTRTPEEAKRAVAQAAARVLDASQPEKARADAALELRAGDFDLVSATVARLLASRPPEALVLAALAALDAQAGARVPGVIARSWKQIPPPVRGKAMQIAFGRRDRLLPALDALASKELPAEDVDSTQRAQLLGFPDPAIAARAKAVFGVQDFDPTAFEEVKGALSLAGDATRGRAIYRQRCAGCHRADGEGGNLGPSLASVHSRPSEQVLRNILYPSLMVLPSYQQQVVETTAGEIVSGVLASSSAASVTIRRPGQDDAVILRRDVKSLTVTPTSVMPEGLLAGLSLQDLADLLDFVAHAE